MYRFSAHKIVLSNHSKLDPTNCEINLGSRSL